MGMYSKRTKNIKENSAYYMFGLHAVKEALKNPDRKIHELWISQNARAKIFSDYAIPNIPIFNLDKSKNLPIIKTINGTKNTTQVIILINL